MGDYKNRDRHLDSDGNVNFDAIEKDCSIISGLTHHSLRVKSEVLDKYIPAMLLEIRKHEGQMRQVLFENHSLYEELKAREGLPDLKSDLKASSQQNSQHEFRKRNYA